MAEVYRARDTRLDRMVAIKVPAVSLAGDLRDFGLAKARGPAKAGHYVRVDIGTE
jgi:hypothetical protein